MASIGHPPVGDPVYGGNRKSLPGLVGQCLHARKLRFIHPTTQSPLEVECPLPDWFERVLRQINK
jgi:23S rRNA pseudouridine1911/1915/1917 synthase